MRAIVQKRHVGFAKEPGGGAQRAAKPAVEKHRILASEKLRPTRDRESRRGGRLRLAARAGFPPPATYSDDALPCHRSSSCYIYRSHASPDPATRRTRHYATAD